MQPLDQRAPVAPAGDLHDGRSRRAVRHHLGHGEGDPERAQRAGPARSLRADRRCRRPRRRGRRGGDAGAAAGRRADARRHAARGLAARWQPAACRPGQRGARAFAAHAGARVRDRRAVELPGGQVRARYTVDYSRDAAMGRRWAWILVAVTLASGALVGGGSAWFVRRGLSPMRELAAQTRAISPASLDRRLALADPAEELLPWVEQFNALMDRLERAYAQLEAFNADVAHELRTPLAALIGETEVALARERTSDALRETLASNLEEMQRLSAMVNDMLFLAQADRGAVARRGEPVSLAALARQVVEFHEAALEDAGLALRIEGDAAVPVDEALFKRALSNLLGNATRFADAGSTVVVRISAELAQTAEQVEVVVQNRGQAIAPQHLPRLFDRFFRGDDSRCCPDEEQHHGLGLAIVAAIARMHAGRTLAESDAGLTRVGFTLAAR
ncbi:MAG: heavy metal sensor histidine kinase [Betaproteobacteria bacterium]|nr:heavy metal sensor histidine kinase [Betaproteobacteria bacterium]